MDSAYECDATRALAQQLGFVPVVPPNPQHKRPWELGKPRYRYRNEVERLLRRLKAWRRVSTRYDETDVMFAALITVPRIAQICTTQSQFIVLPAFLIYPRRYLRRFAVGGEGVGNGMIFGSTDASLHFDVIFCLHPFFSADIIKKCSYCFGSMNF